MKFTTPKTIRAELNRLGVKAHGMKVSICNDKDIETEAIISMGENSEGTIIWYFCHDENKGKGLYIKEMFGKTGSDFFYDDDDEDFIKWFSYQLTNKPMKKVLNIYIEYFNMKLGKFILTLLFLIAFLSVCIILSFGISKQNEMCRHEIVGYKVDRYRSIDPRDLFFNNYLFKGTIEEIKELTGDAPLYPVTKIICK